MNLVVGFSRSVKGNNAIWVIVDRLKKLAHFLPIKTTFTMEQYAQIYVKEVVRLHVVPIFIIPGRDSRFTSKFWKSLRNAMGTELKFSIAYHPQTMDNLKGRFR